MRLFLLLSLLSTFSLKAEEDNCRINPFGRITDFNLSVLNGNFNDPQTADKLIREAIESKRISKSVKETMFIYQSTNEYKNFRGSDTEGSILVSGDMHLKNYSVGHALDRHSNKILANGRINIYPNANYDSLAHHFTPTSIYGDKFVDGQKFPFQQESGRLIKLSRELFSQKNNGQFIHSGNYHYKLVGDNHSTLQIFTIEGEQLKNVRHLYFHNVPGDSTVIINVKAPEKLAEMAGFIDLGFNQRKTIFNFDPESEYTVHLHNIEVPATILAPTARIFFSTGLIRGQVIARDFVGSGQINYDPFEGCLPKAKKK